MRYIINSKVFDTDNAELAFSYINIARARMVIFDVEIDGKYPVRVYKTKSKKWIRVRSEKQYPSEHDWQTNVAVEEIDEKVVKRILMSINDVDTYNKLFGTLEEI